MTPPCSTRWRTCCGRSPKPGIRSVTGADRGRAGAELSRHAAAALAAGTGRAASCLGRSEEHTSELQSLMRSSYAVFCLKKKNTLITHEITRQHSSPTEPDKK